MVGDWGMRVVLLLFLADTALASISNVTLSDVSNILNVNAINEMLDKKINSTVETRRTVTKKKLHHSTSSSKSGGNRQPDDDESKAGSESLGISISSVSDTDDTKSREKYGEPKSTVERRGWRKWHRKCTRCPEEMDKKWRDPSIKWICGAYQRARRSFKSLCMMHYRNCQDGTMFVKIYDHRCRNSTDKDKPYGDHFFYDYKVVLSQDTTKSSESTSSSLDESTDY